MAIKPPSNGTDVVNKNGKMTPVWYRFFLNFINSAITTFGGTGIIASDGTTQYGRTITGTADKITVTNGNGATGNPTLTIASTYAGQNSMTTLGTITTGVWNGSIIPLAYGGTNANLTASNGGIFYSTGSAGAILSGTATANKILLSGASTTPSWSTSTIPSSAGATANKVLLSDGTNYVLSTPTFPNASATSRKIIVSDGTNWVASTETYAVPSTSGKIMQSDGTNWTSATPTGSGTPVLATSPTLVTPLLGTPTSGTLTNCTGYIEANISFTDITTNNSSTSNHGFLKKLDNNSAHFMDGTGAWSTPSGGLVVQRVSTETGAVATGTTVVPQDDTIPQNTEGTQFMTLAITPNNTNNILVIDTVINGATSTVSNHIAGLFQDSTANALAVSLGVSAGANNMGSFAFRHVMTAGTTSSTTFKIRIGPSDASGGTFTFNGQSAARKFGGVYASSMMITEYTS